MRSDKAYTIVSLLFVFAATSLFAFGRSEEPAREPVNTEWILCVTALDVSALPQARQLMGDTVVRSLANTLANVSFRFRGEEEYIYYRVSH